MLDDDTDDDDDVHDDDNMVIEKDIKRSMTCECRNV